MTIKPWPKTQNGEALYKDLLSQGGGSLSTKPGKFRGGKTQTQRVVNMNAHTQNAHTKVQGVNTENTQSCNRRSGHSAEKALA